MQQRPNTSRRGIRKVQLFNLYCLVSRWVHCTIKISNQTQITVSVQIHAHDMPKYKKRHPKSVNLYCLVSRWVRMVDCIRHDFIAHCVEIARGASILTQVSTTPSHKYQYTSIFYKYLLHPVTSILHKYIHPLSETLSPSHKYKYLTQVSTTPSHPLHWRDNLSTGRPCTGVPICDKVSSLLIRIFFAWSLYSR